MNLTQKEVDDICKETLIKINLSAGCNLIAKSIVRANISTATTQLEDVIFYSVSRCLYEVLKQVK